MSLLRIFLQDAISKRVRTLPTWLLNVSEEQSSATEAKPVTKRRSRKKEGEPKAIKANVNSRKTLPKKKATFYLKLRRIQKMFRPI